MSQTPGFGSGANTDDAQDLNANGEVYSFVLLGIDNGVRNDASFKNVKVMRNNDETLFNTSWAASQYIIKRAAALQASTMPTGLSGILWDGRETGEGGVNAGNRNVTKGWKMHLDHAGFTGTYKLSVLHSYVEHETLA